MDIFQNYRSFFWQWGRGLFFLCDNFLHGRRGNIFLENLRTHNAHIYISYSCSKKKKKEKRSCYSYCQPCQRPVYKSTHTHPEMGAIMLIQFLPQRSSVWAIILLPNNVVLHLVVSVDSHRSMKSPDGSYVKGLTEIRKCNKRYRFKYVTTEFAHVKFHHKVDTFTIALKKIHIYWTRNYTQCCLGKDPLVCSMYQALSATSLFIFKEFLVTCC